FIFATWPCTWTTSMQRQRLSMKSSLGESKQTAQKITGARNITTSGTFLVHGLFNRPTGLATYGHPATICPIHHGRHGEAPGQRGKRCGGGQNGFSVHSITSGVE